MVNEKRALVMIVMKEFVEKNVDLNVDVSLPAVFKASGRTFCLLHFPFPSRLHAFRTVT